MDGEYSHETYVLAFLYIGGTFMHAWCEIIARYLLLPINFFVHASSSLECMVRGCSDGYFIVVS